MKRILSALLILVLALSLTACGGLGGKNAIVGAWELVDGDGGQYGTGIEFKKDGTMLYGLTSETFAGTEDFDAEEYAELVDSLSAIMKIKYKIKSADTMEITVSAMMGLAKEKTDVKYSLNGDTLVFDNNTYQRVK